MTLQTQAVLKVLLEDPSGQHYGLAISKGADLPTGTIYPILARLEQAGWVTSDWEDIDPRVEGRRRRRYYRLSPDGAEKARAVLAETVRRISPRWTPAPGTPSLGGAPA
jgi:DNA-binding PadR family transcriptional regulator